MSRHSRNRLIWTGVFGVTMGLFEAAVVVYLRRVLYPEGFSFPLKEIDAHLAAVELAREAASLVMIASVAALAGRRFVEKLGYFMYVFGIWDILYYVFLKIALDWPASVFDMDILFLIPVPWVGPVLAPVLVSATMIAACVVIVWLEDRGTPLELTWRKLAAEVACGVVVIISFCLDWRGAVSKAGPGPFAWWLFLLGLVPGIGIFAHEVRASVARPGGRSQRAAG